MSIRKRNEFLDDDDSGEEAGSGYDSEAAEESRGALTGRASKRRRLERAGSDEDLPQESEDEDIRHVQQKSTKDPTAALESDRFKLDKQDEDDEDLQLEAEDEDGDAGQQSKLSAPRSVTKAQKAAHKSGVVYISRVPPFMKPQTLKHYLAPHAPSGLGRIFLTPEDHAQHARRIKNGGNKKKSFTDGWVEFASKWEAKIAAQLLNGNIIGGKKGGFYHDDLWNMKYLRGFKWSHLTEQIANENAERAARMREEVRRTKVENKRFVEDVERGKMLEGMEGKRKAKGFELEGEGGDGEGRGRWKEFKQRKVQRQHDDGDRKAAEFLQRAGRKIL